MKTISSNIPKKGEAKDNSLFFSRPNKNPFFKKSQPSLRGNAAPNLQLHPALRILLRSRSWLLKRTTNTISKHVARHGRRIASKSIHTIFKKPKAIRSMVSRTVREGGQIAENATKHGVQDVIEQGGVRIFQQTGRIPGKVRTVIEKDFGRVIGTKGERVLRVIIDQSGRVVSAFPVDRFMAMGLSAGIISFFGESTASANEQVREQIEAYENRPTDWAGEIIDLLNPLGPAGTLNEGEDLGLEIDAIIYQTTEKVIREIEEAEKFTLGPEQRRAIFELVQVAVGSPLEFERIQQQE